ncbi:ATP-binding protein [Asticcacaulis taihuensis]|uniref:ATP-binding protein n=1 Tax=Asticcacaulis taihuensis TaxID=260084 RepID=UPI003F7C36C0
MKIDVPGSANLRHLTWFLTELDSCRKVDELKLDFGGVQFTTPSWLVMIGGALRRFKANNPTARKQALNFRHLKYAAHMGFFEYFGVKFGQAPDAAAGSDTYVPMRVRSTAEVRRQAALKMSHVGDVVHAEAEELATLLTRQTEGDLQDALAYSVREIIRNVVEHSGADEYTFAAQYWPSNHSVELVVSDQGIGLSKSLKENPNLNISDDETSVREAILPGISSKAWRRTSANDEWANSGYGLFMTERLCRLGGEFRLMSGDSLLRTSPSGEDIFHTVWPGTFVTLRLDTGNLGKLSERLAEFRHQGRQIERQTSVKVVGPSRASQSPKPQNWKGSENV